MRIEKQIRQHEGEMGNIQRTPLVAITASVLSETQEKCYAAGMDDFIAKPYRKFELYKRIAAIKDTGKIFQQLQNHEKESLQ